MKKLHIKTIRIDGGTQSRVEINNELVQEYAHAIDDGAEFPAVVVFNDGVDNWLADGFHRFHAHGMASKTSILADVRTGTARDAVLYSLGANGTHGLNRTNADKRKAITTMLNDAEWVNWSDNAIAKACHVTDKTVTACRFSIFGNSEDAKPVTRTVERNGKTYEQNTANIGKVAPAVTPHADMGIPINESVVAPEDEYTPLDAAHDQIQELQAALVVANIASTDSDEQTQAATYIAELQQEIKLLRSMNKQLTLSRDTFQNQVAEMQKQINRQRREIDRALGTKTA